ncbi:MAG: hypothetical protein E6G06_06235 [Actinobacteria bacterium]|nr:MAG: hypothetical protein E6G06_06235 [Actinomycetota bacterium]
MLSASAIGAALLGALATQAAAAPVAQGFRDRSYAGTTAPTAEKPQSKLWFHDGSWWGVLFRPSNAGGGKFTIQRLDLATQTWVDTGVAADRRESVHLDALSDGNKLYVASSRGSANPSLNRKVRVWGYTYDATARAYTPDRGFPVDIADGEINEVVIDRDGTGILWATFVLHGRVMVTHTEARADRWVTPYVLPVGPAAIVRPDPQGDQSGIVRFGGDEVGIMFSSQIDPTGLGVMYWATHVDGTGDHTWNLTQAFSGNRLADEHINLKALPNGDPAGLVLAAVKTSLHASTQMRVHVLRLGNDGTWTSHEVGTVTDNQTRPLVQIDTDNRRIYVFATSPCCRGAVIYVKVASLDDIVFPPGPGTPFIQSARDTNINNPSGTKQTVGNASGLLVLAGDDVTHVYLHNYEPLGPSVPGPPPAPGGSGASPVPGGSTGGTGPGSSGLPTAGASTETEVLGSRLARDEALIGAPEPRNDFFGFFGPFIAFTGRDILTLVGAAAVTLLSGIATVAVARRRVRRTSA